MSRSGIPAFSVFCLLSLLFASGCISSKAAVSSQPETVFLRQLFDKEPGRFRKIFQNPDLYRVQIIYTRIDRCCKNKPRFSDFYYNLNRPSVFTRLQRSKCRWHCSPCKKSMP